MEVTSSGVQVSTPNTASTLESQRFNYDHVYTLKGRMLTLIDATFSDPEQRKAQKDIVWQLLRDWADDVFEQIESAKKQGSFTLS